MLDTGGALTVTNVDPRNKKRSNKTIIHMDYETTVGAVSMGREQIQVLRNQIEERETEVARLREILNTRDNEDTTPAIDELKRLQAAFDRCEQICEEKLAPYRQELSSVQATARSKQFYLQIMEEIARERQDYVDKVRNKTDLTYSQLENPKYKPIDETQLLPLMNEALTVKSDIDSTERSTLFGNYKKRCFLKLNEQLGRNLEEAVDNENKAIRKTNTIKQNLEIKLSKPKPPPIDDSWFDAQTAYQKNFYLLQEAKQRIKMLNDENERLAKENHELVNQVSKTKEELISLEKYIPHQGQSSFKGANERSALTNLQIESDELQVKIFVEKHKIAILQKILENHQKQVASLPPKLQATQESHSNVKDARKQSDLELDQTQEIEANLIAKKIFLADADELIQQRLGQYQNNLTDLENKIRKLELILKKQEMIRKLNEEMYKLKCANLERVAGTVSQVIEINSEIDKVPSP